MDSFLGTSEVMNLIIPQQADGFDMFEENQKKQQQFSSWQKIRDSYYPEIDLEIIKELPSGCYKIQWDNRQDTIKIVPFDAKSDEAFRFSESYTDKIIKEVQDFWNREDLYKQYNFIHKRGLLLEGPAGNGKSVLITLLIEDILKNDGIVFIVNSLRDMQLLTENLSSVIKKIESNRKIITVIEDIDKLIAANSGDDSFMLDLLDGKNSIDHHLVIMTSNDTTSLSEALLRPSRVDMRFEIGLPDRQVRSEYFRKKGVPEDKIDEYSEKSEGLSFAQLKELFVGTIILGKDIDKVINQLKDPFNSRDYLNSNKKKMGL